MKGDFHMNETDEQGPMPQEATNYLFVFAAGLGIGAFVIGFGILGALGLGLLR
jgi:hypothetical protein